MDCLECGEGPLRSNNRSGYHSGPCYDRNRARSQRGTPEYEEERVKQAQYYQANRDQLKFYQVNRRFGLSLEEYEELLELQGFCCAICRRHRDQFDKNFGVDHSHACCPTTRANSRTCGTCVRLLLCKDCNTGIGFFREDADLLRRAVGYLELFDNPVSEEEITLWIKEINA